MSEIEVPLDEAPAHFPYEIIVPRDTKSVIIKKGNISKKTVVLYWRGIKPIPRGYFLNHVIKTDGKEIKTRKHFGPITWTSKKVIKAKFKARWNIFWAEALSTSKDLIPTYSQELANLLLADDMIQHRNGVAKIQGFFFDSTFLKLIVLVFLIGIPFGIFMDTILNLIPTQIVHWTP